MLSLDEAIARAKEVANEQKRRSGICVQNDLECDKFSSCLKCAEEHEQIAEWLEELKVLRHEANECRKAGYKHGHSDGYNKAIDDFIHECDKYCGYYAGKNRNLTREDMLNIAERLKGRMNNEFI